MKKISYVLVMVLVLSISAGALALDLGYFYTDNVNGISIRASEGKFKPQLIGHISANYGSFQLAAGLRGLYSLGQVGVVDRYLGAGVSYRISDGPNMDAYQEYGGQVFVGVEFPLGMTPFQLAVEVGVNGRTNSNSSLTVGNRIGAGIHYRF